MDTNSAVIRGSIEKKEVEQVYTNFELSGRDREGGRRGGRGIEQSLLSSWLCFLRFWPVYFLLIYL